MFRDIQNSEGAGGGGPLWGRFCRPFGAHTVPEDPGREASELHSGRWLAWAAWPVLFLLEASSLVTVTENSRRRPHSTWVAPRCPGGGGAKSRGQGGGGGACGGFVVAL